MAETMAFDLNVTLKEYLNDPTTIATPEADRALQEVENDPEELSAGLLNSVLNPIVDAIAQNPEALQQPWIFDSLQFLLK